MRVVLIKVNQMSISTWQLEGDLCMGIDYLNSRCFIDTPYGTMRSEIGDPNWEMMIEFISRMSE